MRTADLPFNVELMDPSKQKLSRLRPVTVSDIYDGKTTNFHQDGLFSTATFGDVGSEDRNKRFSYIDMGTFVLHPTIYKELIKMKSLYRGILSGKSYAKWNAKDKDFERSNEAEGDTGYSFFMSKWNEIKFRKSSSDKRQLKIDLIDKNRDKALVRYLIVLPAGLRDLTIEENGQTTEDEINGMYRRVLGISNSIAHTVNYTNDPTQDTARWSMQLSFLEIYETIRAMLEGKKGFIQAKWSSRRVFNGTRNVISAMTYAAKSSTDESMPDINDTIVGLFQYMKGTLPVVLGKVKQSIIGEIFSSNETNVQLINPKTLKLEYVEVSNKNKDRWVTTEGLEKTIHHYGNVDMRHRPIMIEGKYIGLIYDDGKHFRVFRDIDTLPEWADKKNVRPITWTEYFYSICYEDSKEVVGLVTRYPITGIGSIYPTNIYLKTTVNGKRLIPLNHEWQPDDDRMVAVEFPIEGETFIQSMAVNQSRLAGLGGD